MTPPRPKTLPQSVLPICGWASLSKVSITLPSPFDHLVFQGSIGFSNLVLHKVDLLPFPGLTRKLPEPCGKTWYPITGFLGASGS